jgi:hypothetical protein
LLAIAKVSFEFIVKALFLICLSNGCICLIETVELRVSPEGVVAQLERNALPNKINIANLFKFFFVIFYFLSIHIKLAHRLKAEHRMRVCDVYTNNQSKWVACVLLAVLYK